jgi:hypothetical protein
MVIIAPVWPLYALSRAGGRFHWWFSFYRWILLLLFIGFVVIPAFGAMPSINQQFGNRLDVWDSMTTLPRDALNNLSKFFKKGQQAIEKTVNPGQYYTGLVDNNKDDKPLGVTITDLRAQDHAIDNQSDIVIFGTVGAKSFIGESVHVRPDCALETGKEIPRKYIDPPLGLDIIFGSSKSFECTLTPQGEWGKGSKTVLATVEFPFQTWSYITYTFVDEERARNIARQGQDMRQVLNINEEPTAIYTSGPITVGMGGTSQPITCARTRRRSSPRERASASP